MQRKILQTMCKPEDSKFEASIESSRHSRSSSEPSCDDDVPIERVLEPPSMLARYTCVAGLVGILGTWGKLAFADEMSLPNGRTEPIVHSGIVPLSMTVFYLISLPLLRMFTNKFLSQVNVKVLLHETMILYNVVQVLLNGWMVYRILDALLWRGHPFIQGPIYLVDTGATYAVYVHYYDKYLEYLDTYFMILRGKMDQVNFPTLCSYQHFVLVQHLQLTGLSIQPSSRGRLIDPSCPYHAHCFHRCHSCTSTTTLRLLVHGG